MNLKTLSRDLWLLTNFRNGWEMVCDLRGRCLVDQATLFNGDTIVHSQNKVGLLEAILEIWFEKVHFPNDFYLPNPDDTIVDIGANIGLFTIQSARLNPNSKIAAFEPSPENFACLFKNVSNFGLERVALHKHAIGSHYEQGLMVETRTRSLEHQLIKQSEESPKPANCESVNVIPLEEVFDVIKTDEISLLKVDIEGAEQNVFASTSERTLKRINRLALEYHDNLCPGTLSLITEKLTPTHHIKTIPSGSSGCGLLFAACKV